MPQRMYQVRPGLGSTIVGLLVIILGLYLLVRVAAFTLKTLLAGVPIFFGVGALLVVGAYFIDKRVVLKYFNWLGATLRVSPLRGIIYGAASVIFAPFVGLYLLAKAFLLKRVKTAMGDMAQRAEEHMRRQSSGAGASIGVDDSAYEEVRRDDGMVIRIPKE